MDEDDAAPLASFESKWAAAHPEFALALTFVPERERAAHAAYYCLVRELEHAAFSTRDAEPAALKLQWWAEEFVRAGKGEARHPLTRALALRPAFETVPASRWFEAVRGALVQRDPEPAADAASLMQIYSALYSPLAAIEAVLFEGVEASATTAAACASRGLREVAELTESLRAGRLPLPLDVLARHRLTRGDLGRESPRQVAALRDWIGQLAADLRRAQRGGLGVIGAATLAADRVRARRATRSDTPLTTLERERGRLPWSVVWAAWRAGRRSPH